MDFLDYALSSGQSVGRECVKNDFIKSDNKSKKLESVLSEFVKKWQGLQPKQRSEEWYNGRRDYVGGSEIAAILPSTRLNVYWVR